ncbi:hypothetical protein D8674_027444 [Pyrus ussuriensis x Pyrus communis]|uniref:Uncharacterized protein n=1 Tax=Pyrus ussuriensis x Pyrus communis TaxID=2448454 RepID=A0A5N5IH20_9ROSA|nr:hypothetical protein D8674_027444 [Pyrus ussuriensis x Pyrus communis]
MAKNLLLLMVKNILHRMVKNLHLRMVKNPPPPSEEPPLPYEGALGAAVKMDDVVDMHGVVKWRRREGKVVLKWLFPICDL